MCLSLVHFYSFADGKCHSRKSSLFRRVTSAAYIPSNKSSSFVPLQHSKLIFYIPKEVRRILLEINLSFSNGYRREGFQLITSLN